MQKKIIYFFLLICLLPAILEAGSRGRIKGKITDLQSGEPLVGANVIVEGTSSGATSDLNGEFVIQNMEAGSYKLRASFIGYQSISVSNVRVNADLTVEQNFQLPAEGITVATVSIIATKPLVNKDNTNAIRVTTSEDIQALPIRGVANIYALSAGVTVKDGVVHMRGGRFDEVGYYLEGITVTDPVAGGNAVRVSQDALEEISVQAGGYTAEFGGANSGIIRQELKTGSSQFKASAEYITDNLSFKSKNKFFDGKKTLGAYSYGYDEASFVLSGPLFDPRVKFFGNVNYVYNKDVTPQPWPGINMGLLGDKDTHDTINFALPAGPVYGNQNKNMTYVGTLSFDLAPVILRLSGTFTQNRADQPSGSIINAMFNTRIGVIDRNNGSFNAKITHVLSPNLFYELSGGLMLQTREIYDPYLKSDIWAYGDSVANANAGIVWARSAADLASPTKHGRFAEPSQYIVWGNAFDKDGATPTAYSKYDRRGLNFAGNLSWIVNKTHSVKIGGELMSYTVRNFSGFTTGISSSLFQQTDGVANADVDAIKRSIMINNGVNNYGYDVLGNKSDAGFDAPHKPVFASAYVQDKIEYQDLVINLGLRFDYYNIDNKRMIDPTHPENSINVGSGEVIESGWENVPSFSMVSPRLGFSFPVTDRTMFHAQYGKFVQETRLADAYLGYLRQGYQLRTGYFYGSPTGNDLKPTRTTQYEIGFTQQLTDFMSVDITGYYSDKKDQTVFIQQTTSKGNAYKAYNILGNGDFSTTKGIELTFTMRRYQRLAINGMVSFNDARGTGSYANSNRGIVGAPLDGVTPYSPKYISPLEFNNAVRANMNFDYRFGDDDGPALLNNFGVSALLKYTSGHPFTLGYGDDRIFESDARNRQPIEPLGNSTTPATFQVDLRVDKTIKLYDKLSANIYVMVTNLFDRLNIENVFLRTGSTTDDGYISNPDKAAKLIAQYGQQYVDFYKAINLDYTDGYVNVGNLAAVPYMYGPPRQIRLGIRLEY